MPRIRLTDKFLQNTPYTETGQIEYYDEATNDLYIRITKRSKRWYFRYSAGQKNYTRFSFGVYPDISLSEARKTVEGYKANIHLGIDPRGKHIEKTSQVKNLFSSVIKEYRSKNLLLLKPSTQDNYNRWIDTYIIPHLKSVPVKQVKKKHLVDLYTQIAVKEQKATTALQVLRVLSTILTFAIDMDYIESKPVLPSYLKKQANRKLQVNDVFYSDKEIRKHWKAFDNLNRIVATNFFKVLYFLGTRKTETSLLEWTFIKNDSIYIPGSITKNGHDLTLPLIPIVKELIEELRPITGHNRFIFNDELYKDKPFCVKGVQQKLKLQLDHFKPHSIRHTVATNYGKIGAPREVVGRLLNHSEYTGVNSVTYRYNHHQYLEEKNKWMNKWAKHLIKIIK